MAEELTALTTEDPPVETTETPPPETATAPETAEKPEENAGDDDGNILEYIRDRYGLDLTEKYKDPDEGLRGLAEAYRKVGEKNEAAQRWSEFQKLMAGREQEVFSLLNGQTPPPSKPASDDWLASVTPEQVKGWQALVEAGKATPDVAQKLSTVQAKVYDAMLNFALRGEQALAPMIDKRAKAIESKLQELRQTEQERAYQQAVQSWADKNASVLYVEGDATKGDTVIGKRARELYDQDLSDVQDPVRRADMALKLAMSEQPRVPVPKRPGKALRQPAIAAPPTKMLTPDEFFAKYIKENKPPEDMLPAYLEYQSGFATATE